MIPVVLVILDGLGDRAVPELEGRTPAEAARTPVLDALARRGANGVHVPLGWGRAPASEVAHWALLGYEGVPFPGRAVLEGLGAGLAVPEGVLVLHAALRTGVPDGDAVRVAGRPGESDGDDALALLAVLAPVAEAHGATLEPLGGRGRRGEALLTVHAHATGEVSDTDPFFEHLHPWLRPVATAPRTVAHPDPAAVAAAADLERLLVDARRALRAAPVNARRRDEGLPPLDLLTTKWAGVRAPVPPFAEMAGTPGATVSSGGLYRGLAALLGLAHADVAPGYPGLEAEMRGRIALAQARIAAGAGFVHVHTKAPDEAGHTKLPHAKRDAVEQIDAGLAPLLDLSDHAVVAVTGDHATPSTGGVLHTGDPTPVVIAGGAVRPDAVEAFGERPARGGDLGVLAASDLLPLMLSAADRPAFLGHAAGPRRGWGLPDHPEPMPGGTP